MPDAGLFLAVHVFSALLPPVDPEDRDYYDVLGVAKEAGNEDIRKAYKKKSLQLHPDKVAQRGTQNKEEAAAEYERVQEAYQVLVNEEKRQRYHALKCSPTRYRFVQKGALSSPAALFENLGSASFVDKSRLVALVAIFIMLVCIQPVLVATKINHELENRGGLEDANWTVVLIPYWTLHTVSILFWCLLVALVPTSARLSVVLTLVEQLLWFVQVVLLARAWDQGPNDRSQPFRRLLLPMYLAMFCRWLQSCLFLQKIRSDVDRMVSIDYLESVVLDGRSFENIQEDERERILSDYILVSVPEHFEAVVDENETSEEQQKEIETQKIESSPEYDAAIDIYNQTFRSLANSALFGIPFIVLLVRKLDGNTDASWWLVFIPLWIYLGVQLLSNCFSCCCGPLVGDDEILVSVAGNMHSDGENSDDNDTADDNENQRETTKDDTPAAKEDVESGDTTSKSKKKKKKKLSRDKEEGETHIKDVSDEVKVGESDDKTSRRKKRRKRKSQKEAEDARASSIDFASVDGDAQNFNKAREDIEASGASIDGTKSKDRSKSSIDEKEEQSRTSAQRNGASNDAAGEGIADDDEDDDISIDEDTYRAFQSAYAEAEQNAAQKRASSAVNCCIVVMELLILCLVVAKLEAAYDSTDPDDVGFNTFWILFPFLLFFGLICCTCACLIYGAGPMDMDYSAGHPQNEDGKEDSPNATTAQDEESPIFVPPPQAFVPPPDDAANHVDGEIQDERTGKSDDNSKNAATTADPVPVDMDDLD